MKNNVLIIAYYFPPVGGGGVQRTTKFVKYLPEFGWEPVVLTVREEVYKKAGRAIDVTLLDDISPNVHIVRTNSIDLARVSSRIKTQNESKMFWMNFKSLLNKSSGLFINPDAQMLWIPVAVREGLKIIKKYNIGVIYSTGNPWSDHITGMILRRITGIPFVVDYRDPWNVKPYVPYSSKMRKSIQFFLETMVMKSADQVIFATKGMKRDYREVFANGRFEVIRNGFDASDFTYVKPKKFPEFTFLYAGNIPGYFKRPSGLIYAMAKWLEEHPELRERIMINFLGKKDERMELIVKENHLLDVVYFRGYKSHKESIAFQLGADVLFLALEEDIGKTAIPGKLFEYLACGKPILALVPRKGKAADILRKEGREEFIVSPGNVEAIKNAIATLYEKHRKACFPHHSVKHLEDYTRKKATEKLSKIFFKLKR